MTPRLLDLFCGAGGAVRGDATELVQDRIEGCFHFRGQSSPCLGRFDAVHMSCPCQGYTALTVGTNAGRTAQPKLVAQMREWADATGLPYIIENVQGSDVRRDLTLCGEMFRLDVIRHRYFEVSGFTATAPYHVPHRGRVRGWRHGQFFDGPYFAVYGDGGGKGTVAEWQKAMGIDWTDDRHSIAEAIPPAYTEHIGAQLMAALGGAA